MFIKEGKEEPAGAAGEHEARREYGPREVRESREVGEVGGGGFVSLLCPYQRHRKCSIGSVVTVQQLVGTAMRLLT